MSLGSYCTSSTSEETQYTVDTEEDYDIDDGHDDDRNDEQIEVSTHRHNIISYDDNEENEKETEQKQKDVNKRKLSRNLSDHLYWKMKSNKARLLRAQLESEMESQQWITALSICKKILDLQAFNFEPLYHFYCGFIYETGFNNYESAERHYRVALQLEQSNSKHVRYYARILRRLERYDQSQHVYEYGLDQHPCNQFIRYEYAYLLWISQKYEAALSQLTHCLESNSDANNGENVFWLFGRIQLELEQFDTAQTYLNHAIQLKSADVGYRVDYILYLINCKKYKEAFKYYHISYELITNTYSTNHDGDDDADDDNNNNNNNNNAAYKDTFSYVYLQSVYAFLLSLCKKTKKAQQIFNELITENNNNYYEIHFYFGMHLFFNISYKAALFQFLSALNIEDNWAITYYYIALVLYELNDYHSCLDFLKRAIKMNSSIPIIRKNGDLMMSKLTKRLQWENEQNEQDIHHLAVKEYKKRNWQIACILFLRLLQINPQNTNYQHNLAMVLFYGFDNNESAEKYFRKSLKSCGSSHPDIIRHYNVLLINQKRFEESHAYFHILFKIINKNKTNLSVDDHIQYAIVTMSDSLKLYHEAKHHLKIALKQRPNDGQIIAKYAILLKLLNSYNLAKEYFKHALSFIPKDIEIRYEFASLLWTKQDYNASCSELKICLNVINAKREKERERERDKDKNKKKSKVILVMEEKCCILYGIILIEMEQYHAAKQFLLRSIELNYDIRCIAEIMLLLIKCEDYDEALKYYLSAKQHIDYNIDSWYLESVYAVYCSQTSNLTEADDKFKALLTDGSPCYFIHFFYAKHLHYKHKNYLMAKEQYIKAISIEDNWAITYWHFGICLFDLQEYKSAETFIKKSYEINSQIPVIGNNCKHRLSSIQNAINERSQIIERDHFESNKAKQQKHKNKNKKRYAMQQRDAHLKNVKNALGINKKTKQKTKTKTKAKKTKRRNNERINNKMNNKNKKRRKSKIYGSNSNLLLEDSLDNFDNLLDRDRNESKKKKKQKKRVNKSKFEKDKFIKDSYKMYNDRYYRSLQNENKRSVSRKSESQESYNSITMISASEEYSNDEQSLHNQSSTISY